MMSVFHRNIRPRSSSRVVHGQARESEMGVYTFKTQSQKTKNKDKMN